MKNRWKKIIMILGICSSMSLVVYGCGKDASAGSDETLPVEDVSGQNDETDTSSGESGASGGSDASDEDISGQSDAPSDTSAQEELCGDITEVAGDGKFVVNKIYTEELDDGSGVMIVGSNEVDMELITISYDENTEFIYQTIWNGGADHEEKPSSPDALAAGLTADMKGYYEGEEFHAMYIQLVEVVL